MSDLIDLAGKLIACRSITPEDAGCQQVIGERLEVLGFTAHQLRYGEVDNLWIYHGQGEPVFTFLGHTDVVPTGPLKEWDTAPFIPSVKDGFLYGRGAADMKSSIAAMVVATEHFIQSNPEHKGTLSLLLTSDEEGASINGTRKVIEYLQTHNIQIDWCLVGEPSSETQLGDVVKNGRRGSLSGTLTVHGVQGHVAYPQLAVNPIHQFIPALQELCNKTWDEGNEFYPPTSFQVSNIHAGTGANNVIPSSVAIDFNYRFCNEMTADDLRQQTEQILNKHNLNYDLVWTLSGLPFLTKEGKLLNAVKQAIYEVANYEPLLSTSGGTSDGRFVAPTGAEVVELGPVNGTIHKVNECVRIADIELLSNMYERIMQILLR